MRDGWGYFPHCRNHQGTLPASHNSLWEPLPKRTHNWWGAVVYHHTIVYYWNCSQNVIKSDFTKDISHIGHYTNRNWLPPNSLDLNGTAKWKRKTFFFIKPFFCVYAHSQNFFNFFLEKTTAFANINLNDIQEQAQLKRQYWIERD